MDCMVGSGMVLYSGQELPEQGARPRIPSNCSKKDWMKGPRMASANVTGTVKFNICRDIIN